MEQACYPYVPHVLRTTTGDSVVSWDGRVYDLTTWATGRPRTGEELSDDHLNSAMSALAAIHRAWAKEHPSNTICPGVIRRLTVLEQVLSRNEPIPALSMVASRAARILRDWLARPLPLQLCLRDVHAQHILFTGMSVTGVIDFGAVDWDHPAVDLARYLGDTVGTTPERLKQGVRMYQQAGGPFSHTFDDEFVLVLADAGLVGSVLRWLTHPPRTPAQWQRMQTLLSRLEARAATA
jgi:Ser/Thr protein kinase RdoA (MazF antagonist)